MNFDNEETQNIDQKADGAAPSGLSALLRKFKWRRSAASETEESPESAPGESLYEDPPAEDISKDAASGKLAWLQRLKPQAGRSSEQVSDDIFLEDAGVLSFGTKKAAIGLTWTSIEEDTAVKDKIEEMNDLTRDDPTQATVDFKLYTDTLDNGFIGLGSPDQGQVPGMRALVTMLPPEVTGPRWIGVFQLSEASDTWWVGSIRDGKVFDDQILRSREAAEQIFLGDLEAPDWTAVYAPLEWGIPQTRREKLHELVDLRSGSKLKSCTPIKDNLPRILLGSVLLAAAAGGYFFIEHQRAEQERELRELRRRAEQGMTFSPQDVPWHKSVEIGGFIEVCMKEMAKSAILIPGWEAQPISCSFDKGKGTISTGWSRSGGSFSWLRAAIPPDEPAPRLSANGETASWGRTFEFSVNETSFQEKPWSGVLIEERLRERFQVLGAPLAIRPNDKNQKAARTHPVFNSHDIRISAPYRLTNFGDILEDVPALVPQALLYNMQTGIWDLAIKAYHPPMLPPPPR